VESSGSAGSAGGGTGSGAGVGDTASAGGVGAEAVSEAQKPMVTISSRFIVKVFLGVPGEINHSYKWEDFSYTGGDDMNYPRFNFKISNTGNTIVMADPKIEFTGFPPLKEPVIELPPATIQPGAESQNIDFRFKENPFMGFYFVKGAVVFSEYDIMNNEKINPETQARNIFINLTPWYLIVIIILVLLAVVAFFVARYIGYKRLMAGCREYKVVEGDTIISVAQGRGIPWKVIVKINRLKAPYALRAGQKLMMPSVKAVAKQESGQSALSKRKK
jgi:hypothetical protein